MSSKCTIQFDNNPLGIYYAGQTVSGTAELITTRPKTIRSILITISGFAEVRWTENITKQDPQGKRVKAIETYSSSEIYYSNEKYVYGQSGGTQLELAAGKYAFPFQTTIPPNAPTSFNGAWGQIQHEVTLIVDRPMRYNNIFKQAYTVVSPYDLNLDPKHAKNLHKIEKKTFCWSLCCGSKDPMVMNVNVPFAAYALGQNIYFKIVLDNQSDVNCSDVKVRLMKKIAYTSRNPETKIKVIEIKIADNHCGEVNKFNKAEFNEFLQIPSTTPLSPLENCSIIKVSYTLKFIAKVSRIHRDLVIEFPLIIGTVPVYRSIVDDGAITTQPGGGAMYKPIPPPNYEEDAHPQQFESNIFKPKYPVFSSASVPSGSSVPAVNRNSNLYPTANVYSVTPTKPAGGARTPSLPPSAPELQPLLTPGASQPMQQQNISNSQPPLGVLGFSLPPDYKPTSNDSTGHIGWK